MIEYTPYIAMMSLIISVIVFSIWGTINTKNFKPLLISCLCFICLIAIGINCYEHKVNIDNDTKCECMICENENSSTNSVSNQIIVQNNENVEIYIDDDSEVTIIENNKWTCCDEEIKSKFCPECGKKRITE